MQADRRLTELVHQLCCEDATGKWTSADVPGLLGRVAERILDCEAASRRHCDPGVVSEEFTQGTQAMDRVLAIATAQRPPTAHTTNYATEVLELALRRQHHGLAEWCISRRRHCDAVGVLCKVTRLGMLAAVRSALWNLYNHRPAFSAAAETEFARTLASSLEEHGIPLYWCAMAETRFATSTAWQLEVALPALRLALVRGGTDPRADAVQADVLSNLSRQCPSQGVLARALVFGMTDARVSATAFRAFVDTMLEDAYVRRKFTRWRRPNFEEAPTSGGMVAIVYFTEVCRSHVRAKDRSACVLLAALEDQVARCRWQGAYVPVTAPADALRAHWCRAVIVMATVVADSYGVMPKRSRVTSNVMARPWKADVPSNTTLSALPNAARVEAAITKHDSRGM